MTTPRSIINYLLPFVVTAGAYSRQIQGGVKSHDPKGDGNMFETALSDADLTIQAYLEVVLLARFPELHFFSEEQEKSLNRRYFTGQGSLEVLLDPIDGTRSYLDNREQYQIMITLHDDREIVGAICYKPRLEQCYLAVKGEGCYRLSKEEMLSGAQGARVSIVDSTGPVLVWDAPKIVAKLTGLVDIRDLTEWYVKAPGELRSTDLIEGRASAVVHQTCQAIDGGALVFLATEAGAIATHYSGEPVGSFRGAPTRVLPDIVVSSNRRLHDQLLAALR